MLVHYKQQEIMKSRCKVTVFSFMALRCCGFVMFQETGVSSLHNHVSLITLTNDPIPYLIPLQMDLSCFHNAFRSDLGFG